MSRFREVGNESNHHAYIHAGAYSDAEGSQEQSPPGGDVGQWEVTFVHCLGGLENNRKKKQSKNHCCNNMLKREHIKRKVSL